MNTILKESILSLTKVSDQDINAFQNCGQIREVEAGNCFIRAGQIPSKFGFVYNGLFRYLYTDDTGKEFTKAFMPELSFISSYSAMRNHFPSYYSIEALEDSEIFEINYSRWSELKEGNPSWNLLLIALLEKGYAIKERRERELLLLDAESRYKNFLGEFPEMEKRLKQHMIASYLGITPVALSRIRNKMKPLNPG